MKRTLHFAFGLAAVALATGVSAQTRYLEEVFTNAQVTVTLYFKKSSTGIAGRLYCRGAQISGVDNEVSTTCPDDTTRNNVQIQFTPTAAGVVEIEVEAWYVSSTTDSVIVDDIAITQA